MSPQLSTDQLYNQVGLSLHFKGWVVEEEEEEELTNKKVELSIKEGKEPKH